MSLASSNLTLGQSTQATATPRDAKGNALVNRQVAWMTSNPGVATVSTAGLVAAVGVGTVSVTATSEGTTGSAALQVQLPPLPAPVTNVSVALGRGVKSLPTGDVMGIIQDTIRWEHVGPESFVAEIGSTSGAADVLTQDVGTVRQFVWSPGPRIGTYYTRIKAKNVAGFTVSPETTIELADIRDVTEALLLGTGPLAEVPQQGCPQGSGRMAGWAPGSRITFVASASLSATQSQAMANFADLFAQSTGGVFSTALTTSALDDPPATAGQAIAVQIPDTALQRQCGPTAHGCSFSSTSNGFLSANKVLIGIGSRGSAGGIYHEFGHGVFGFCHFSADASGGRAILLEQDMSAMMGAGILTDIDLLVVKRVYAAGLRPGAVRAQFVSAGLVKN